MLLFSRTIPLALLLCNVGIALDGIVTPPIITAGQRFEVTFIPGSSDASHQFRVFLAAASIGQNGPFCYLQNLTTLTSPFMASIPAVVGPDGTDYSIGIADISTSQGATFSNKFNFTGGTGTPTNYEAQLDGAPFWDAYDLPCSAMPCARLCAQANYPTDLTEDDAYQNMADCIEKCSGVTPSQDTGGAVDNGQGNSIPVAIVTLGTSMVLTAYETVVTGDGTSYTEAIVAGTQTLTLDNAAQTISSATVSLAKSGLVVGGTSIIPFTTVAPSTPSASVTASTTNAAIRQSQIELTWLGYVAAMALL